MGIALFIANALFACGSWYSIGRASIYRKLMKDYGEALTIIRKQQAIIEAYETMYNTKETEEENGEQD